MAVLGAVASDTGRPFQRWGPATESPKAGKAPWAQGRGGGEAGQAAPGDKVGACRVAEAESVVSGICLLGKQKKKRRKGGEIYHKKSVKSAEFLHEKGGISIWPQLPSEATEASNENEFKTQADVFLDGVRGTERRPPPRLSPRASLPSCPRPHWASVLCTRPPVGPTPALKELPVQWGDTQTHKVNAVEDIRARRKVCDEGIQRLGGGGQSCEDAAGLRGCVPCPPDPGDGADPSEGLEVWTAGSGTIPRSATTTRDGCSPPRGVQYTWPPGTDTRVLVGTVRQPLRPKGSRALLQGLLTAVSSTGSLGASSSRSTNLPSVITAHGLAPGPRSRASPCPWPLHPRVRAHSAASRTQAVSLSDSSRECWGRMAPWHRLGRGDGPHQRPSGLRAARPCRGRGPATPAPGRSL